MIRIVALLLMINQPLAQADSLFRSINVVIGAEEPKSLTNPKDDPALVDDSDSPQAGISNMTGNAIDDLPLGPSYTPFSIGTNSGKGNR